MSMIYMDGALLGTAALASAFAIAVPAQIVAFHFHDDHVLGTSLDITAVTNNEPAAVLAVSAIRAEIARLDKVLSGWRDDSDLQTLNSNFAMQASSDLFQVISACEDLRRKTGGFYSARLGTLLSDARDGAESSWPDRARAMASEISTADIQLDPKSRKIVRPQSVKFAVDGLAKGYIIDRALDAARRMSPCIEGLMIDIGGDMRCWGRSTNKTGWTIGVVDHLNGADNAPPRSVLRIDDKAVATSGKGNRSQTLLSPVSGQPSVHVALATVLADTAADADALATAFAVMAPERSMTLADRLPGIAARVVTADAQCHTSSRWKCFVYEGLRTPGPIQTANTEPLRGTLAWPNGFLVDIAYEVPAGNGRRERPYVTIWIANEKNDLVRTLAFFAGKRRYFESNYVFWQRNSASNQAIINSVTRPTRGPGRYTLTWDGLDDRGASMPQGRYFLFVEASREHGDHSIQRIELDIGTTEFTAGAEGVGELGPTKVSFGRAA